MTKKNVGSEKEDTGVPDKVAIEGKLPLTAIDIESQKDITPPRGHALQGLHKWFAARPTPACRLSILASILPEKTSNDELLRLMQIGRKEWDNNIAERIEKKYSESKGGGTLDDHYDYPNPNTQSPSNPQIEALHNTLKETWGDLPVILDPTAGRGTIPFESLRYCLPTKANELNPVPSLIMRMALKYAPEVGSLKPDVLEWRDKIQETAKENVESYFPTENTGREILNCALTYLIKCDSCTGKIPLTSKWWLHTTPDGGDAVRPIYDNGDIEYEHVKMENISGDDFDPDDAPVKRGDAECPHCGVVTESTEIRTKIAQGEFEYSIYGVNYKTPKGDWEFRAGSEIDQQGMDKAAERVDSDFELMTFLSEPIEHGFNTSQIKEYGMDEWRDVFSPRQLVVNYEYLKAFEKYKSKIRSEYDDKKSEAILTLLTFGASKSLTRNSRLSSWRDRRGVGSYIFSDNNFSLRKMGVDNNLSAPRKGYVNNSNNVIESYETLVTYLSNSDSADLASRDAAKLTETWERESIDVAIVDPPYYSSIQYAELSDIFYVLQKRYLEDVHSDLFSTQLTNKSDEAVANPSRVEELTSSSKSGKEKANDFYRNKMEDIFSEIFELLTPGGIMTVMFTHRDMDAWDTLTSALIDSGFTITATHPIKTEMSDRVGVQGKASADSSILLVGRKRSTDFDSGTTLWEDIESGIRTVARDEAEDILNSGYRISKTDTAIAAYGPTLQRYAEEYPVVDKKGENIKPRRALSEARKAVTSVIAEQFLTTEGIDKLDSLTRWYILAWLIYENDKLPYDEGRQLGVAAGVDIDDIKRPTKLWGKYRGDIQLKDANERVQDIVMLQDDSVDSPSSRKYPVNPTDERFTYTIDTVHAAIHVYEREGANGAWDWLTERNLKSDSAFGVAVTALLEVLPKEEDMYKTLVDIVSGETGDYLDVNLDHIDMSGVDRQTSLKDHTE